MKTCHLNQPNESSNPVYVLLVIETLGYRMLFFIICIYISSQQEFKLAKPGEVCWSFLYILYKDNPLRNLILNIHIVNPASKDCLHPDDLQVVYN